MEKINYYRKKYSKININWKDSNKIFCKFVEKEIKNNTKVLDVGCGESNLLKKVYQKTNQIYGVDPNRETLKKNKLIRFKYFGYAEKLPFKNNFFDIVVFLWVFEHLEMPKKAIEEAQRVLKKGGKLVFLTPNKNNIFIFLSRILPITFKKRLISFLYKRKEVDIFPTRYRMNSSCEIEKTMCFYGLSRQKLIFNSDPSFLSFNELTFKLACLIEKIFIFKIFQNFKVHIIGKYIKN